MFGAEVAACFCTKLLFTMAQVAGRGMSMVAPFLCRRSHHTLTLDWLVGLVLMRVKVGDDWFEGACGRPIMVELTKQDKLNIANMNPEATRYAIFAKADLSSPGLVEADAKWQVWMDDGKENV